MAKNKSPKTISIQSVIDAATNIDVMHSYIIDEQAGLGVKYNTIFDRKKVEKLIVELYEDVKYVMTETDYEYFETEEQLIRYEMLLIIKYFSHFKDEIGNTFEEKMRALDALHSLGLFDLFFDEIFDEEQVADVMSRINISLGYAERAEEVIKQSLEQVGKEEAKTPQKPRKARQKAAQKIKNKADEEK